MKTALTTSTPLGDVLAMAPACSCNACSHGCTMGSGVFVEGQIDKLAVFLKKPIEEVKATLLERITLFGKTFWRPKLVREGKPWGHCIFYDGSCTIHEVKPLQCRVAMGCRPYGEELQLWFLLSHVVDKNDPKALREYKAYLDSGGRTLEGGKLEELVPDKELRERALSGEIRR